MHNENDTGGRQLPEELKRKVVGSGEWFGYFAAHAPEIPEWFKPKEWDERITVPAPEISPNHVRWGAKHSVEDPLAHLVRWRMTYAAAMVAGMREPNTEISNARERTGQPTPKWKPIHNRK